MDNIFTINISANVVAWYGAIVATAGFIFSAYSVWRDSARLKISIERHLFFGPNKLYRENTEYLSVVVINKGRRPIKVTQAEFLVVNSVGRLLLEDSFADYRIQILTEDNPKTQFFLEASMVNFDKIYCVVVKDGTDKKYKKYIKMFPTILKIYYKFKRKYGKSQ